MFRSVGESSTSHLQYDFMSAPCHHHDNASDQLHHFLTQHDHCFADSVKKTGLNFMSSDLKQVLLQIENTQKNLTPHNLSALQIRLGQWQRNNPREFSSRSKQVEGLKQEIRRRQSDPLLGAGGSMHTNRALLQLVRQVYGVQAYTLFANKIPALKDDVPLEHATLDNMQKALSTSYFQNFKQATSVVHRELGSPFDQSATSLVTSELAKLPHSLLQTVSKQGFKVAVTHDRIANYSNYDLSRNPHNTARGWNNQQSERDLPGSYYLVDKTVIISLNRNHQSEWQINDQHGSCNLVLHESAHGIDHLLGESLGLGKLSQQRGFHQAWRQDYHLMGSYFHQQGGVGQEEAFAEGMAKAFDSHQSSDWPHVEAYMRSLSYRLENRDLSAL